MEMQGIDPNEQFAENQTSKFHNRPPQTHQTTHPQQHKTPHSSIIMLRQIA
jgi:hypothetical protein